MKKVCELLPPSSTFTKLDAEDEDDDDDMDDEDMLFDGYPSKSISHLVIVMC